MLIGFKRCFATYVEEGSKTCTIRATRKILPRVGDICHCYVDARQKTMRLLGRWPCVGVREVRIEAGELLIDGVALDEDERNALAWRDGFRPNESTAADPRAAYDLMLEFFRARLPFQGTLIEWQFSISSEDSRPPGSSGLRSATAPNAGRRSKPEPRS